MTNYVKKTKDNTNLPLTVLWFLQTLNKRIELRTLSPYSANILTIAVATTEHTYCYDAIRLVEKTYNRKGWKCKMKSFYKTESNMNTYVWELKK